MAKTQLTRLISTSANKIKKVEEIKTLLSYLNRQVDLVLRTLKDISKEAQDVEDPERAIILIKQYNGQVETLKDFAHYIESGSCSLARFWPFSLSDFHEIAKNDEKLESFIERLLS
jgi:hypothetical protein